MKNVLKLGLILTLTGGVFGTALLAKNKNVDPTQTQATPGVEIYLVGDFANPDTGLSQGWSTAEGDLVKFGYNTDHYEIVLDLKEGNQFKAYDPYQGKGWIGAVEGLLNSDYFEVSEGGNWRVKEDGRYAIGFVDGWETYGDASYAWTGGNRVEVEYCSVTVYNGEEIVFTDNAVPAGSLYDPGFIHVEDYYFDGLYTDASLLTPATIPLQINEDTVLYGKFTPVEVEDYHFIVDTDYTNAYVWGEGKPADWPGLPMDTIDGTNLKYIVIPAEYRITGLIFNDGTNQTGDIEIDTAQQINVVTIADNVGTVDTEKSTMLQEYVAEFRAARIAGGDNGICNLTSSDAVVTEYVSFDTTTRQMLAAVNDHDEYSIYDTMEYVLSRLGLSSPTNRFVFDNNDGSILLIIVTVISLTTIISLAYISKKKVRKQ